jgi:hypothetical protein
MTWNDCTHRARRAAFALLLFTISSTAGAQTNEAILAHIAQEKAPLLDTLRALVNIESGSSDYEGRDADWRTDRRSPERPRRHR